MTPKTSAGFACAEFAEQVLGIDLMPWQRWLLIHALELLPDGSFRFRTVVVLVARQNGKSTLAQVLALFFMYVRAAALVIGTAQNLDIAEEVWQGAVDIAEDVPELADEIERVVKVNGKKSLELTSGERYKVQAANRRGGRGLSGDLVLMDELREHQSWDSWSAVTKTTLARMLAQIWALSNAGDAASIVLRHLRLMAHLALGDPDGLNANAGDTGADEVPVEIEDDALGIFEWSAPPDCRIDDPDGTEQANPALGHTLTERALTSARRTDPEWVYRTECLCQWSAGTLEGPFPPGSWEAGRRQAEKPRAPLYSTIKDATGLGVGVDVSADRSHAHIAFAGRNQAGELHVEVVASRAGVEWVVPWLTERLAAGRPIIGVAVQGRGAPVSPLAGEIEASDLPAVEWQGADLAAATGTFYDLVRDHRVVHLDQPVLDVAAATAVMKRLGDAWVWDRTHSPTDVAPLVAATAAVYALTNKPTPSRSAYESTELMIV